MMANELYQKQIIELARESRKRTRIDAPDTSIRFDNPLCGDRIDLDFSIEDGRISHIGFKVRGCALCEASAGLVVNYFTNENLPIKNFMEHFDNWLLNKNMEFPKQLPEELKIFLPIQDVKNRHVCIKMPFEAFFESINKK